MQSLTNNEVKLIALISLRGFSKNKARIKSMYPNSRVIPMFPKHKNWRLNKVLIRLATGRKAGSIAITRGIFANQLVRDIGGFKAIVFDGRGAYAPEFSEYLGDGHVSEDIATLEHDAVHHSDFRLAVSNALVDYWRTEFQYNGSNHVVVPCTLNETAFEISESGYNEARRKFGFREHDVVYVYSGSVAGWQSLEMMDEFCSKVLRDDAQAHFIFMSQLNLEDLKSFETYPDRIHKLWVDPSEVKSVLLCGDYGVMIRERTITNQVASPTKFAEYLLAGLKVITTPQLGDYSQLVEQQNLGFLYDEQKELLKLEKVSFKEKTRLNQFAIDTFTKQAYKANYLKIIGLHG